MRKLAFICLAVICLGAGALGASVETLRCEYRENPLGIDVPNPHLSWTLASDERGDLQTAYQILVASSPELLAKDQGDLWDSGKVQSDETNQIPYDAFDGMTLVSARSMVWKVRSWDRKGEASAWSAPAAWTMGLLDPANWQGAKWIGGAIKSGSLLLRREFEVKPGLKRATAFVSGVGQYEFSINGSKVSADVLTPGWSDYDKTVLYDTYDVTAQLRPGANAAGFFLGNGMYDFQEPGGDRYTWGTRNGGPQAAFGLVRLEYADGSVENVVTDGAWHASAGPVTFSHVYAGEDYDARLEQQPKRDAAITVPGPAGILKGLSCAALPIRNFAPLAPKSQRAVSSTTTVYDLGQNAAVMLRLQVKGPAGSSVKVTPAELVNADGTVQNGIFQGKEVYWRYTLSGKDDELYVSHFFYVGARYLQAELSPAPGSSVLPTIESISGLPTHSSAPAVGDFSCSNPLFNRIYSMVRWAQQNNMMSLLTDCPTREKFGYLEEDHLNGPALRYNFDLAAMFGKILNDASDSQTDNGLVPNEVPEYRVYWSTFRESAEWESALILVAWQQYEFLGDTELMRLHYGSMKRLMAHLAAESPGHILSQSLGDWRELPKKTPNELTGTATYFADAVAMGKMARLLGHPDDASQFEQLASDIRNAFNQRFVPSTQTGYAMALSLGLVPDENRAAVFANLIHDLDAKGLTSGEVGYRYLLRALADGGRSDVIYRINNQSAKPGYGFQLGYGATSLTEDWDYQPTASQDHFMLGQINEWFFHDLAGIQRDESAPGFKKIIIKPAVVGDLTFARASYDSINGKITSAWKRDGSEFTLDVTIPDNTSATVYLPDGASSHIGAGKYRFTARLAAP